MVPQIRSIIASPMKCFAHGREGEMERGREGGMEREGGRDGEREGGRSHS